MINNLIRQTNFNHLLNIVVVVFKNLYDYK